MLTLFASSSGSEAQTSSLERSGLRITVKPTHGSQGTIDALTVKELVSAGPRSGEAFRMKAALSAIGVLHIADSISNLSVHDAKGPLQFTTSEDPPVTNDDSAYRHWQAKRPIVLPVTISYRIATEPTGDGGPPLGMKPAGGGVAGSGIGFLLLPENIESQSTRFSWDLSNMPAGSIGAITAGSGTVNVPGAPSEMAKQWALAGPAVVVDAAPPSGFHGYLLGTPPFDGRETLSWGAKAYGVIGDWFGYLGLPPYNLFVRALTGPSFGTGTAGEGKGGSLVNVGQIYWAEQDLTYIRQIIFHEMTHQWVGLIKGRGSWFEEGLTVYVTATLPCGARLSATPECADAVNKTLRTYYKSPGRNWSQARIDASPFQREDVREVPYGRGELYFADLNAKLLAKSHGKQGLRDVLGPLLIARRDGKGFDQADWEAMLMQELGPEAVRDFRQSMIEGTKEIVPPSDAFGPCLERINVQLPVKGSDTKVSGYEWHPVRADAATTCRGTG